MMIEGQLVKTRGIILGVVAKGRFYCRQITRGNSQNPTNQSYEHQINLTDQEAKIFPAFGEPAFLTTEEKTTPICRVLEEPHKKIEIPALNLTPLTFRFKNKSYHCNGLNYYWMKAVVDEKGETILTCPNNLGFKKNPFHNMLTILVERAVHKILNLTSPLRPYPSMKVIAFGTGGEDNHLFGIFQHEAVYFKRELYANVSYPVGNARCRGNSRFIYPETKFRFDEINFACNKIHELYLTENQKITEPVRSYLDNHSSRPITTKDKLEEDFQEFFFDLAEEEKSDAQGIELHYDIISPFESKVAFAWVDRENREIWFPKLHMEEVILSISLYPGTPFFIIDHPSLNEEDLFHSCFLHSWISNALNAMSITAINRIIPDSRISSRLIRRVHDTMVIYRVPGRTKKYIDETNQPEEPELYGDEIYFTTDPENTKLQTPNGDILHVGLSINLLKKKNSTESQCDGSYSDAAKILEALHTGEEVAPDGKNSPSEQQIKLQTAITYALTEHYLPPEELLGEMRKMMRFVRDKP
jgi:hypothetical protein